MSTDPAGPVDVARLMEEIKERVRQRRASGFYADDEVRRITQMELEVTETEPGFRGNTATGALKPARLETGATVSVPLFINKGDVLKIDTRTRSYVERARR